MVKKFQLKKVMSNLKSWKSASLTLKKTGKVNYIAIKKYLRDHEAQFDQKMKDSIAKLIGKLRILYLSHYHDNKFRK